MEQEQIHKKQKHEVSNTRFWIVWGIAAAIVISILGFYGWKTWALNKENARFTLSIENTQKRLLALAPGTEQLIKKQNEVAKRAGKYRTIWSTIMEQIIDLQTSSVHFSRMNESDGKISATCQATSWKEFSAFIDSLEKNPRVKNIRISSTSVLSSIENKMTQSAEITFHFSPEHNENE